MSKALLSGSALFFGLGLVRERDVPDSRARAWHSHFRKRKCYDVRLEIRRTCRSKNVVTIFSLTCLCEKKAVPLHIEIKKQVMNNQTNKVMEKKMYAIKIVADGLSAITREGTGVPHRNKIRYCEYYLPFFGTREEATAAALGLGDGCAQQVKKFYECGWKTVELDGEILTDSAI